MKTAIIFFLSLLFYLPGEYASASADGNSSNILDVQRNERIQQAENVNLTQHSLIILYTALAEIKDDPVFDDDDQDDEEAITRNYISPACNLSTTIFSTCFYQFSANPLSFYKDPSHTGSCKYIEQRVLRI